MKARTFIILMFLLLVFAGFLLVAASPRKQQEQKMECPMNASACGESQAQAAEGGLLLETLSRHLLHVVQ